MEGVTEKGAKDTSSEVHATEKTTEEASSAAQAVPDMKEETGQKRERECQPESSNGKNETAPPPRKKSKREIRRERRQQKRAAEVKEVEEKGVVTAEMIAETTYEFVDGLRCVVPYDFTFTVFAKERWYDKPLLDVWPREFGLTRAFCEHQISTGRMKINGKTISTDAVIRHHDQITNVVHRHEPPVVGDPMTIIAETPELVVINKPASIPVHPCGAFRHNCVMFIMAAEYGRANLHRWFQVSSF